MDAFYINLDTANVRRKKIEEQITSSSLPFNLQRFPALRGQDYPNKSLKLSNGQWGCWLSHLSIINSSLINTKNLLIIEDDEYFNPLLNHIVNVINELDSTDWDLLYLDLTTVETEDYLYIARKIKEQLATNLRPSSLKIPKEFTAYGTHAYVINGKSKQHIFNYLAENINSGLPIDNIFCHGIQEGEISAFMALPLLTAPGSETTISQINHGNHPLEDDWINFRKLISIYNIQATDKEYLNKKLEIETRSIIKKRLDFSCLLKFEPINK